MHKPIQIKNLSFSFSHKTCFEDFNSQIIQGNRIAIIGRNGSGKTTLLNLLRGTIEPSNGSIEGMENLTVGFVPQAPFLENNALSGSQCFNAALSKALSANPDILLLDEPTNHLDKHNRKSLMRYLQSYAGTLIIVSHDLELLRNCIDTLWHINSHNEIQVFSGQYDDYIREIDKQRSSIEQELLNLERQKKEMHHALMKEQKRASKSRAKGEKSIEQKKWPTIVSSAKANRALETTGRKKSAIEDEKQNLIEKLSHRRLPEIILPKFSLESANLGDRTIVSISNGCVGYSNEPFLLEKIALSINSKSRIAIQGDNASGKSTFLKAIMGQDQIIKSGEWNVPVTSNIGYLDQHYDTLFFEKTVFETIYELVPMWSHIEVRRHLNDFLFRTNEEANSLVAQLSGGEKARLSLAQIAAKTPKLLILDEITNNLDLETKAHVVQVLKTYPGAMVVISHDADFLKSIEICDFYEIRDKTLLRVY